MSQSFFLSKLLSVPKFLEMSAVSVEITSAGIYYLSLKNSTDGLVPDKYGLVPLAPGEVVHSDIVNREAVVKALELIKNKTKRSFVRYSVPEEKTYIFKVQLPELKADEVRSILDFKLEENIPLSSKEAVFDYDIVPNNKKNNQIEVVVSATSAKHVEDIGNLLHSAGFIPTLFCPESNNLAKALINPRNQQVLIITNIKESNIIMSLVVSGVVYQTSTINFGSNTINELLANYYRVSLLEAGKIKKEKLYNDSDDNLEVFSYLINSLSALKDEMYKFVEYCNNREDINGQVEKVILSGSDALIYNLSNYLSSNLKIPVEVADIWVNNLKDKKYIPSLNRIDSLNFSIVNGLSLM